MTRSKKKSCGCAPRQVATIHRVRDRFGRVTESVVLCVICGATWHSKARFALSAPDAPANWSGMPLAEVAWKCGLMVQKELF